MGLVCSGFIRILDYDMKCCLVTATLVLPHFVQKRLSFPHFFSFLLQIFFAVPNCLFFT
jgi:hypothetical protein